MNTGRLLGKFALALAMIFLAGCSGENGPASDVEAQMAQAETLLVGGDVDGAIAILEKLDQENPGDPAIAEGLALAYREAGDDPMAALYFETVLDAHPERADLLRYASEANARAGSIDTAILYYERYLDSAGEDSRRLMELASLQEAAGDESGAFDSRMRATERNDPRLEPFVFVDTGRMAIRRKSFDDAESLFQQVVDGKDADATARLEARLGLLETALHREDWKLAHARMRSIDRVFPGQLDKSRLAYVRPRLEEWHAGVVAVSKQSEKDAVGDTDAVKEPTDGAEETVADSGAEETFVLTDDELALQTGVGSVDKPGAEAFVVDREPSAEDSEVPLESAGDLPQEAQPEVAILDSELEPAKAGVELADIEAESVETGNDEVVTSGQGTIFINDELYVDDLKRVSDAKRMEREILAETRSSSERQRADEAFDAGRFDEAAHLYLQLFADAPDDPELAHSIGRARYETGRYSDAEIFASEAVRLNRLKALTEKGKLEPRYTIQYLRVVQRSQSSERFLLELNRAKEVFPKNAEITLALAETYDKKFGSRRNARLVYEEFLRLAPEHAEAPKVRAALEKLRKVAR